MAQRTVHYLFGEMISDQIDLTSKTRFLLGSILPDAIEASFRNASHFKVQTDTRKYFDFAAFREQYFDLIVCDDLYLGYYMHLVEDAFYRAYFFSNHFPMPRCAEEVTVMHNDYHILNSYIVQKYHIQNILGSTFSLDAEPLCHIAPFHINSFLKELANDFAEQTEGVPVFLTPDMLDTYIQTYLPLAVAELRNIKRKSSVLVPEDYSWPAKR